MSISEANKRVTSAIRQAMEEADQVLDASGPAKKKFVLQAVSRITEATMDESDASIVNALASPMIDLIVAASKGGLAVNVPRPKCCSSKWWRR